MLSKAGRFLRLLAKPAVARKLVTLVTDGYLAQTGWVRSIVTAEIVDAEGRPLPWMTGPFVDFVAPRLRTSMRVFEFGAGASTFFYAARVAAVTAIEHDEVFARQLQPRLPTNVRVLVRQLGSEEYTGAIAALGEAPQIVSIDGRDRVQCVKASIPRLAPDAVVILDDSDREEYAEAAVALAAAGFRRLDFWGLSPARVERRCTTVFYQSGNVLGI